MMYGQQNIKVYEYVCYNLELLRLGGINHVAKK